MLGLALTLPMILLSGPLAGYLIGELLLVKKLGLPTLVSPLLMGLGLVGSAWQSYLLILKINQGRPKKEND